MRRAAIVGLSTVLVATTIMVGGLAVWGQPSSVLGADDNEMAVDAEASTPGVVDTSATHQVGNEFDVGVDVTIANAEWQGWQAKLQYDIATLEFVPTSDLTGDTVNESWTYTGMGGALLNAHISQRDLDGDTVADSLYGGSARIPGPTTATGQAAVVRFRCLAPGTSSLHLVTLGEDPSFGTSTLAEGGYIISTGLTDASVTCSTDPPPPTNTPTPTPPSNPTPTPDPHIDRDGIPNASDACPDSPEDADSFEDTDGCPDVDNDGDGICDPWIPPSPPDCEGVDWCPNAPEDYDGDKDTDGCPDSPGDDHDGDGLSNDAETFVHGTNPAIPDTDLDGCADGQEVALGSAFDPTLEGWYDIYDVPVPAVPDPTQNGPRNGLVDVGDVLGVLFYVFADAGGPPNANGVYYDSDKNGDTTPDGRDYDRSPGTDPDPVTGIDPAGQPNGVIDMGDVLAVLAQALVVDCTGQP